MFPGPIGPQANQTYAMLADVGRIAYISGRPGAGKSALAFPLAAELGYSLVTKDLVKEAPHDALYVSGEGAIDLETNVTNVMNVTKTIFIA